MILDFKFGSITRTLLKIKSTPFVFKKIKFTKNRKKGISAVTSIGEYIQYKKL